MCQNPNGSFWALLSTLSIDTVSKNVLRFLFEIKQLKFTYKMSLKTISIIDFLAGGQFVVGTIYIFLSKLKSSNVPIKSIQEFTNYLFLLLFNLNWNRILSNQIEISFLTKEQRHSRTWTTVPNKPKPKPRHKPSYLKCNERNPIEKISLNISFISHTHLTFKINCNVRNNSRARCVQYAVCILCKHSVSTRATISMQQQSNNKFVIKKSV